MAFTFQLVVLLGLSSILWMGADAKCPKPGDCCMVCPEGWTEIESRCFMFHFGEKDWCDAEKACVAEGGNLASVVDEKELDAVYNFVYKVAGQHKRTWLGGHDAVREGVWRWSDGKKYDFTFWGKGEPNDDGPGEDCMELGHNKGRSVNDAPCDHKKSFLCARDLNMKY